MKHEEECRGTGAVQNWVSTIDIPGFRVSFKLTPASRREGGYNQQPLVIVTYYRTGKKENKI